jgi:hypothetical protein
MVCDPVSKEYQSEAHYGDRRQPHRGALQQAKEGLDADIGRDLAGTTIAGILSLIPGIGSAIQSLVDGKGHRNVARRWIQLFVDRKAQLEKLRASVPDESYYGSEKFQTLLASRS